MCKGFDWFRHLKLHALLADPELMQLDGSEQLTPDGLQQDFGDCLATGDEAQLLQQLSTLPYFQTQSSLDPIADLTSALDGANPLQERSNSSSASMKFSSSPLAACNNSSSSSSTIQSLAPPSDPLWLLKHVMSKPFPACCEGIETMTLQELQAHYKSTVHDLSLYLVQHSAGGIAGADEPHSKIQAVMTEHLKLIGQLCICRSELVTALQLVSNCNVLLRHCFHQQRISNMIACLCLWHRWLRCILTVTLVIAPGNGVRSLLLAGRLWACMPMSVLISSGDDSSYVLVPLLAAPTAVLQTNSDTGEQLAEPDRQRISWVVERLKLTQQQQHSIARGMSVFKRLLSPVLQELRQLQQQGDACASPYASNSTGMSGGAGACSGDAGDASQQYNSSSARRRALEQQEQRSGRMKMLLRKVCMADAVSCCSVAWPTRQIQCSFEGSRQRCSGAIWQTSITCCARSDGITAERLNVGSCYSCRHQISAGFDPC
jgi:hypothetical protein